MAIIRIEVAYALIDRQKIFTLEVEEGCTVEGAIRLSGVLEEFSEIDLLRQRVGVFGKVRELTDVVKVGDRIEIYRALRLDPKERRREQSRD